MDKHAFTPEQLHYLRLLSKQYPTVQAAGTEIIRLKTILTFTASMRPSCTSSIPAPVK